MDWLRANLANLEPSATAPVLKIVTAALIGMAQATLRQQVPKFAINVARSFTWLETGNVNTAAQ